jgi:hypothetical protein
VKHKQTEAANKRQAAYQAAINNIGKWRKKKRRMWVAATWRLGGGGKKAVGETTSTKQTKKKIGVAAAGDAGICSSA